MAQFVDKTEALQLKGRDFLDLDDFTGEELRYLIDYAIELKRKQKAGEVYHPLKGKTLGMIFEKSSTRTRVSFEVGMYQLGGQALFLSRNDIQMGRGEIIADTAQVLARYLDGIMIRTFAHSTLLDLAQYSSVPVINALTDWSHPCQVMADYQTVLEHKGKLEGLKVAFIGDGNNMVHSLMMGAAKLGMHFAVASPDGYLPDQENTRRSQEVAAASGGSILVTGDPKEAIAGADIVYTDVWASMGFEEEQKVREKAFANYQVNEDLVKYANPDYLFLHCLPAHRGEEVSAGVIDGPNSVIFDEAENRLHAQKAIMAAIM